MIGSILSPVREAWTALQDTLYFLPPFPARIDTLALLSLLLVSGLLVAEWLRGRWGWPRVLGSVIAGLVFGPPLRGWMMPGRYGHAWSTTRYSYHPPPTSTHADTTTTASKTSEGVHTVRIVYSVPGTAAL